jgi:D-alanine transaminase
MSRIAFVNGRYVPHGAANVHVEDRGYQFSDGVYEVCEVFNGHLVDERRHMARLQRSLRELRIREPMSARALSHVLRETVRRNRVRNGLVYLQVTRGVAKRDHPFPGDNVAPAVVVTARSMDPRKGAKAAENGIEVITVPENRWPRVDIKSVSLLPNVLARQEAEDAGANEAWFVDTDGMVTEGSATNAWIVDKEGRLITRPAEFGILRGITRTVVVELAEKEGLELVERPFSVDEARHAREAFVTSATKLVMPVVKIDDAVIGNGKPGSIATKLRDEFHSQAEMEY